MPLVTTGIPAKSASTDSLRCIHMAFATALFAIDHERHIENNKTAKCPSMPSVDQFCRHREARVIILMKLGALLAPMSKDSTANTAGNTAKEHKSARSESSVLT
eukprot:2085008-Amphidinium_carterae.1